MEFQCCFCGKGIDEHDNIALAIRVENLRVRADGPAQEMFAHANCTEEKLAAILDRSVPFDVEAFEP